MKPWEFLLAERAFYACMALRGKERWEIRGIIERIRECPFSGDLEVQDVSGRWLFVRTRGSFLVTYEDHPVRQLVIIDVRKVAGSR